MKYDRFLTRVWDKEEKEMVYVNNYFWYELDDNYKRIAFRGCTDLEIIGNIYGTSMDDPDDYIITFIPFNNRFIPMQCTGLKDKNDKLIYEGDIIKIYFPALKYENKIILKEEIYISKVTYMCNGLKLVDKYGIRGFCGKSSDIEIMGNIYENQELLEK